MLSSAYVPRFATAIVREGCGISMLDFSSLAACEDQYDRMGRHVESMVRVAGQIEDEVGSYRTLVVDDHTLWLRFPCHDVAMGEIFGLHRMAAMRDAALREAR